MLNAYNQDARTANFLGAKDMKKNFQDQFQSLGNIIQANVETIKNLLTQSERLSEIITDIGDKCENPQLIVNLQDSKNKISESIESLITQTKELFVTYDKLINEVMKK